MVYGTSATCSTSRANEASALGSRCAQWILLGRSTDSVSVSMDSVSVSMNTARASMDTVGESMDTVGESMDAMGAVMNGNVNQEKKKISLGCGQAQRF